MKENVFDTIVFNKHLLIDDGRGAILVDTGGLQLLFTRVENLILEKMSLMFLLRVWE